MRARLCLASPRERCCSSSSAFTTPGTPSRTTFSTLRLKNQAARRPRGTLRLRVPCCTAPHAARLQDLIELRDESAQALRVVFLRNLSDEMNPVVLNQRQKFIKHG